MIIDNGCSDQSQFTVTLLKVEFVFVVLAGRRGLESSDPPFILFLASFDLLSSHWADPLRKDRGDHYCTIDCTAP